MTNNCPDGAELGDNRIHACTTGEAEGAAPAAIVRVLLVDDSTLVRRRIAESISEMDGVAVVGEADDVPAGLRLLEECQPDLLVLDIELPGQSGLDLLKIVKKRNQPPTVIMLSIYNHPRLRQVCLDLGADFYFTKLTEFERPAEVCRDLALRRRKKAPAAAEGPKEQGL